MSKNIADNPAHRLHEILLQCTAIHGGESCRESWQKVLNTCDEGELLARLGKLLELSREVVAVMELPFPRHLPPLQALRAQMYKGISEQALNGHWSSFRAHVDDSAIVALGFAATLLDEREALRSVDPGSLAAQRDRLIELRSEVIADELLPNEVRLTMARYLGRLINSLDEYFITGVFPVLDATHAAIGGVAFDTEYAAALRDTEVGQKVAGTLANVANSVTVATGMLQLAEPVKHMLRLLGTL